MRNQVLYSTMLGLAVMFFVSGCNKPVQPDPTLTLSQTVVSVPAEGGTQSVAYKVTDPTDGAEVSVKVDPAATWISNVTVTASTIDFVVAPNEVTEARSANVTVSYPGAQPAEFTVSQAAYVIVYDYDYDLTAFKGTLYKEMYGLNGENNFNIFISDLPFVDGYAQVGGHYYNIDIYADPALGDALPAGTYILGNAGETASMTFSPDYTRFMVQEESSYTTTYFTAGTIEVSISGDTYTFEGSLTDTEGALHHISYTGPAVVDVYEEPEGPGVLDEALDFEASIANAIYSSDDGVVMGVSMQFTDMAVEGNYVIPPGSLLTIEAYMPFNENGDIATGTYTVSDSMESMTLYPGEDFLGLGWYMGTYVEYLPDENTADIGLISSGTMQVDGNAATGYTITCDFVTSEGVSVKCSWSGMMSVANMPGPVSTLTEDYEADFSGAVGEAVYYGDYYETGGGNWTVQLSRPGQVGDGLSIDLVAEGLDFEAGIPTGTYTAAAGSYPNPGEYVQGYMSGTSLYPTMYLHFTADGYCDGYAPATSGNIDITNNGDGTYDISVECTDDLGHVWSGSWSGSIATTDYFETAGYSASAVSSVKNNLKGISTFVRGAQTPEAKAKVLQENGFKIGSFAESSRVSMHKIVK